MSIPEIAIPAVLELLDWLDDMLGHDRCSGLAKLRCPELEAPLPDVGQDVRDAREEAIERVSGEG